MMTKEYRTLCFNSAPDFSKVPEGRIDCFQWESGTPYRPNSSFKMCFQKGKGIFLKMKSDEKNPRCTCVGRDGNCWEDGCMEFFIKPFEDREEYLNFEMTAKGAFLSAFGKDRNSRTLLKDLTEKAPNISGRITEDGWELDAFIPCEVISQAYGKEFDAGKGIYYGNFYKCADKSQTPHFGSFSPMGSLPPGFHCPELFAKIIVEEE